VHLVGFYYNNILTKSVTPNTRFHQFIHGYMFRLQMRAIINPLNAELNPICYLPALLGAHHFLHVSRI